MSAYAQNIQNMSEHVKGLHKRMFLYLHHRTSFVSGGMSWVLTHSHTVTPFDASGKQAF